MTVLENYCVQQGRYKDSSGKCAILLEDGDDEIAIIKNIPDQNNGMKLNIVVQ